MTNGEASQSPYAIDSSLQYLIQAKPSILV